jgi:hypothetical protein
MRLAIWRSPRLRPRLISPGVAHRPLLSFGCRLVTMERRKTTINSPKQEIMGGVSKGLIRGAHKSGGCSVEVVFVI